MSSSAELKAIAQFGAQRAWVYPISLVYRISLDCISQTAHVLHRKFRKHVLNDSITESYRIEVWTGVANIFDYIYVWE